MNQLAFDRLTRSLATEARPRAFWRTLVGSAAAGVAALWSSKMVAPQTVLAAPDESCMALNHDATCPVGTEKRTKSGNVPTMNGCGPEGGSIKIPQGYGKADYTGSCNQHDVCYEECETPKLKCDEDFRDDMYDACAAAYPGALNALLRFGCYERAYVYYQAVAQFGGDAWTAAQQKACECCKSDEKIYCNCNKKCYDSALQCLGECKVSLGCFTAICGPATPQQCPP